MLIQPMRHMIGYFITVQPTSPLPTLLPDISLILRLKSGESLVVKVIKVKRVIPVLRGLRGLKELRELRASRGRKGFPVSRAAKVPPSFRLLMLTAI